MSRFTVHYRLTLFSGESPEERLDTICREQSAELPTDVIAQTGMQHITGRPDNIHQISEQVWSAQIHWPHELIGGEVSQLLNILFGNISMMPGNQITGVHWHTLPDGLLQGPNFGIPGIRDRFDIPKRALTCTALKPVGFSTGKLAKLCYQFARGGLDIIKDDHGLANQDSATFRDRVTACLRAVKKAAEETGSTSRYFPNITAEPQETLHRMEFAAQQGCQGVLVCPHITGLPLLQNLAEYKIPMMIHPAFSGQLVMNAEHGFTAPFLYGSLWRALGADFVIYPNAGGRFSFTEETCHALNSEARKTLDSDFAGSWPTPGGGMQTETIARWLQSYGNDTVFLAGGSLYQHPGGIELAAKEFCGIVNGAD